MPTILRDGPYRFYHVSHDLGEPPHVHVDRDDLSAKFWLEVPSAGERVKDVHFTEDTISVDLVDGRTITVPLVWYPRLLRATPDQRVDWQIAGGGYGIHWPDIDEDLTTEGLLRGAPAPRSQRSTAA